jgi:hypothetical protein
MGERQPIEPDFDEMQKAWCEIGMAGLVALPTKLRNV